MFLSLQSPSNELHEQLRSKKACMSGEQSPRTWQPLQTSTLQSEPLMYLPSQSHPPAAAGEEGHTPGEAPVLWASEFYHPSSLSSCQVIPYAVTTVALSSMPVLSD